MCTLHSQIENCEWVAAFFSCYFEENIYKYITVKCKKGCTAQNNDDVCLEVNTAAADGDGVRGCGGSGGRSTDAEDAKNAWFGESIVIAFMHVLEEEEERFYGAWLFA